MGVDVFYVRNNAFIMRSVVTNSKGQKEEILYHYFSAEDLALVPTTFSPSKEIVDYHWDIFLWGDIPIKPYHDFDLLVPRSWLEYQLENWQFSNIQNDQMNLPDEYRQFPTERNPHARKELWMSQNHLHEINGMETSTEWVPETQFNVYGKKDFEHKEVEYEIKI